jgi:hypothetical protein
VASLIARGLSYADVVAPPPSPPADAMPPDQDVPPVDGTDPPPVADGDADLPSSSETAEPEQPA